MNKKIGYIFGLLVLGLFIISACELANQNAVGRKIVKNEGVQQRVVDGGAGENIGGANLDYEVFEAPEDVQEEAQAVELSKPKEPFPGVAWVTGLECGGIINEELIEENEGDRNFILTEDLECEGNGIVIEADDVTLVCNGHSISGPGDVGEDDPIHGIYAEVVSGISILGCEISGFNGGIVFNHVEDGEIILNELIENNYGIVLERSSTNTLRENTISNNRWEGIILRGGSNTNTLTENTLSENNYGIYVYYSDSNTLTGNTANNNWWKGIYLVFGSNTNTLTENTLSENGDGIYVSYSDSNTLTGNTANNNRMNGIAIVFSNENILERNNINSNQGSGIVLGCRWDNRCSSENTLRFNTIEENREGIRIEGPNNNNEIIRNTLRNNQKGFLIRYGARSNTISNNNICFNTRDDISCDYIFDENSYSRNTCNDISREQCNYDITCSNRCGVEPLRRLEL
tara:strand:+ start:4977 stop:6356 length:1380 start_codon:yes stop_codon:yes gene_type:complete